MKKIVLLITIAGAMFSGCSVSNCMVDNSPKQNKTTLIGAGYIESLKPCPDYGVAIKRIRVTEQITSSGLLKDGVEFSVKACISKDNSVLFQYENIAYSTK